MMREGSVSVGLLPFAQGQSRMSPTPRSMSVGQMKMSEKRILSAGFGPFIKRRPVTSYSDHHSFAPSPSSRVKSAAVNMPRSHVSVARFYDWSEDLGECVSVSQFYRDLAIYNKLNNEKMKDKTARSVVNPGRMFLRDKAGLTKGEREIIEGIYRNRCNTGKDDCLEESKEDWQLVKSHKDAWLIGKHLQRSSTNKSDSIADGKSDLASSPTDSCNICNKTDDQGVLAPPTTPDPEEKGDSKHIWNKKSVVHRHSHGHPLDIMDGHRKHSINMKTDSRHNPEKKKLYVNVFLPSISGNELYAPHDSLNASLSLPSTEGPMHPLYSEHARNIFREKQEKARFSRLNASNTTHSTTVPFINSNSNE